MACLAIGNPAAAQEIATDTPGDVVQALAEPAGVAAELIAPCEADDAEACTALGYRLLEGDGVPKDEARAVGVFAQACQFGSMTGCTMAGYAYAEG